MTDLQPIEADDDRWGYSYNELIATLGVDVVLQVDDHDYQGDTRLLVRSGDQWGVLIFGWGSCSGCDALEAAGTDLAAVTAIRDGMARSIHWEPDRESRHAYLTAKDWELDYAWHSGETQTFVAQAIEATR